MNLEDGLSLLESLKNKLPKKELLLRQVAFDKAKEFIEQTANNGGVDAQVSKTFRVKETRDVRVDIEVIKGTAFLRINFIDDEE